MKKIITPLLCWWVDLVQRNAVKTIVLLLLSTIVAGSYIYGHFAIDSDMDRLVKQSEKNQWHANNQDYRKTFPDYHRNVLVVVSGASAEQTFLSAEKVYHALKSSQRFDDVFAPMFDNFVLDRVLYNIPTEGVKRLSEKVSEGIPKLEKIYAEPGLVTLLDYLRRQYLDASDMEIMMPEIGYQLNIFNESVEQLIDGQPAQFHLVQKLTPIDTHDVHYQLITVKRAPQYSEQLPNKAIVDDIRQILETVDIADNIQVRLTGEVAMMNDEIADSISSMQFAGLVSVVLLLLILGVGIRSKAVISGMFIMLFMGVIFTIVFTLLVFGRFNTLSMAFVVMLFGLGIDFAVHFSLRLLEVMRTQSDIKKANLIATQDAGVALAVCALTTVIAFISFWPTDYTGLAEMGVSSAVGMLVAYLLSLTFMPAWFVLLKIQPKPQRQCKIHLPAVRMQYPVRTILLVSLVLFAASCWYVRDTRFNYNLLSMRNPHSEAVVTLRELQDNQIVNSYTVAALVDENEDLQTLKKRLLDLPSVAAVDIPEQHLPLFQQVKQQYLQPVYQQLLAMGEPGKPAALDHQAVRTAIEQFIADVNRYRDVFVDTDLQLVDQLLTALQQLLLHEKQWPLLQAAIASGVDDDVAQLKTWFSATPYALDDLPDNIRKRIVSEDGRHLIQIMPAIDMSVTEQNRYFIEQVFSVLPSVAGVAVHEWGVGQVVMHAFAIAAVLSVSLIFIILLIMFRRIKPAIMIFVPMIMVAIFTLAIAKMMGVSLNMANILVVPLIFGLGVDTGIHVVHRYHHSTGWKETLYSSTGQAVLLSALTTIGAFAAIAFSRHQGAASIGVLLSISLSLLLVVTFIVLPALLMMFDPRKPREE